MKHLGRKGALALSVLWLSLLGAGTARAQSTSNQAAAEALFDEAKRLMDQKRYDEACPKLADSQKLDPGVGTLLNLALCYKDSGRTASAWITYREAAAQARAEHQADREGLARKEAQALEPSLTRLVIEVPPSVAALEGLEIKRDGALVPQGLWGVAAPVDPGVRVIDVTARGMKPAHLEVKTEGAGATAKLVVPSLEAEPPPPPVAMAPVAAAPVAAAPAPASPPAAPPPEPAPNAPAPGTGEASKGADGQLIAGLVVGGVGAVAVAGGVFFELLGIAQGKAADRASSASRRQKFLDDQSGSRTIGYVLLGTGGAALIGGVVLVVVSPTLSDKKTARLELSPFVGADGTGLALSGSF